MRIAILNYADVANFGDVLFPFIAEREIRRRLASAEIDFFSPTAFELEDFKSARYDRERLASYDAILLCGGEIVHREDEMLRGIYTRMGLDSIARPTDLVFDWCDLPVPFKAWIAVGMPQPSHRVMQDVARATADLDLVVARGEGTRARFVASGVPAERVETSSDLGWLIPRVCAHRGMAPGTVVRADPYIVVHAMPQLDVPGFLESAVVTLKSAQQRLGINVVGLPLTTCWRDETTLGRLGDLGNGAFHIVDHRLDVFTKANLLGGSVFYVGQSMHGFVATLAAGRPAGLSYPNLDDKFRELLGFLDAAQWRVDDWRALEPLVETLASLPVAAVLERRARAVRGVDDLFDRLCLRLEARRPTTARSSIGT